MLWDFLAIFGDFLGFILGFLTFVRVLGIFRDFLGFFRDSLGFFSILSDSQRYFCYFLDISSRFFGIFWNFLGIF